MKINDKNLKNEYRAYGNQKTAQSRKDCISRKDMVKVFHSQTSETFKTKIINHVSECFFCAQEFELVRQIYDATQEMDKELDELLTEEKDIKEVMERANRVITETGKQRTWSIFPFNRFSPQYVSLAAIVLICVAGTSLLFTSSIIRKEETHVRGPALQEITLIEPIEGTRVTKSIQENREQGLKFRWEESSEIEYYVLKIFTEALLLCYKSDKIFSPRFTLPQDVMKGLEADSTYFWIVTAETKTREKVESKLQTFTLVNE